MSKTDFILFQNVSWGTEIFLYAVCLTVFLYPFMTEKKKRNENIFKKVTLVFLSYIVVYLAGARISTYGWLSMLVEVVLLVAFSRFIGMGRNDIFLLDTLFFCIKDMSILIMESLYYVFIKEFIQDFGDINFIYYNTAIIYSVIMLFRFVLLFAMLYIVRYRLQKRRLEPCMRELCYLRLIPVAGILFGNIILRLFYTVKDDVVFQLYEQYPSFIGLVPVIAVLFYAGIMLTIISYQEMVKLQEEKNKFFVEEQQIRAIRERIGEVDQFYDSIHRMKHEMKNHLTNIKGLAENGNYIEMGQYITRMDESMDAFSITIQTGNAVTDVIINDKKKAADTLGIQFVSEFRYPRSDGYDAYDIAIVINNLLQNALEACEKIKEGEFYAGNKN